MILCTLDCAATVSMSKLFQEYGVHISTIVGGTSFLKQSGETVGVGKCAWYFGNFEEQKKGSITFSYVDYRTPQELNVDFQSEVDEEKTVYSECVDSNICTLSETSSVSGISEADLEKMKVD